MCGCPFDDSHTHTHTHNPINTHEYENAINWLIFYSLSNIVKLAMSLLFNFTLTAVEGTNGNFSFSLFMSSPGPRLVWCYCAVHDEESRKESAESGKFDYLSVDRSFSQVGDPPDMGPEQLALLQEADYAHVVSSKLTRICYGKRKRKASRSLANFTFGGHWNEWNVFQLCPLLLPLTSQKLGKNETELRVNQVT